MLSNETKLSYPALAKKFPRHDGSGNPMHHATFRRWSGRGIRIGGQVIKLEFMWVGGRIVSSVEAVERFHAACAAARNGGVVEVAVAAVQSRGHAKAAAILEAAGI